GGTRMTQRPRCSVVGGKASREGMPRKARLVTREISRWRTCAIPAPMTATPTARAQMYAVRRVTFAACGAMCAWASPGPLDGATGSPSVVDPVLAGLSGTTSGSRSRDPRRRSAAEDAPPALEEHRRRGGLVDTHPANDPLQQALQLPALRAAQVLQRREEICLG